MPKMPPGSDPVFTQPEVLESIREYHCDWHGTCDRYPWVEVIPHVKTKRGNTSGCLEFGRGWSYLCRRHFWFDLIRSRLLFWKRHGISWSYACWHISDEDCVHGNDKGPYPQAQPPFEMWRALQK